MKTKNGNEIEYAGASVFSGSMLKLTQCLYNFTQGDCP